MFLVTTQNKRRAQERRGLIIWIITLPFRMIAWLYNYLFIGRDEEYHKETFWRCNYCGHTAKDQGGFEHMQHRQQQPTDAMSNAPQPTIDETGDVDAGDSE